MLSWIYFRMDFSNFKELRDAWFLIEERLPLNKNFLEITFLLFDTAINTVPTGLSAVAPVGPAMPVIPIL